MYSTCIHCHAGLGTNESIEHFPVGRRLAFDAAKGRLWVVCGRCKRWNLTPVEERWEAIEECERQFRGTRLRASTDNIGLARLASGTELVRVGNPQRPEIAAWRYARNLKRRWLAYTIPAAGLTTVTLGLQATQSLVGFAVTLGGMAAVMSAGGLYMLYSRRARAALPDGRVVSIGATSINAVRLQSVGDGWGVAGLPRTDEVVTGTHGVHALRAVTTAINHQGARQPAIDGALDLLAEAGEASRFITSLARVSDRTHTYRYTEDVAIALEMALHEDAERRALDGELADLRAEWSMAEEIAALADNMFLTRDVAGQLRALKGSQP